MITLDEIGKIRQSRKAAQARWPWWRKIHHAIKNAFLRTEEWPNAYALENAVIDTVAELSDTYESMKLLHGRTQTREYVKMRGMADLAVIYERLWAIYQFEIEYHFSGEQNGS